MYTVARRRPYGKLLLLILAVVVVAVGAVVAVKSLRRPAVTPAGRAIAGVAIGGMDEKRVRATVETAVRARVEQVVTARVGGTGATFTIAPAEAGITLDVGATVRAAFDGGSTAVVSTDEAKLAATLAAHRQAATDTVVTLARPVPRLEAKGDASFTATAKGVTRTEGRPGWAVDAGTAAPAVVAAVSSGQASVTLDGTVAKPGGALAGVDQLIGTFTTYHPCCAPRVTNIHLIAKMVDGTVIAPGTTFSLNEKVGERTRARGFVAAPAIVEGELEDQLGGGISQFSTTLFNSAWFAGLPILEHQPHSKYISRYPPGREATLDWGNIDQVIRNDTGAPVVIRTATTGTSVTVALYGSTGNRKVVSETGPRVVAGADGGFSIRVTRTVYDDGKQTGTNTLRWTYTGLD